MQVAAADLRVGDKVITLEPGGSFCRVVTCLAAALEPPHDVVVHLGSIEGVADMGPVTVAPAAEITVQR